MRAYLAGPMTGRDDLNRAAFDAAAVLLRSRGHDVVSPVDLSIEVAGSWEAAKAANASSYARFLARDVVAVAQADAVVFLPGWESSNGARLEAEAGLRLGRDFFAYDALRLDALDPLSAGSVEMVVYGTTLVEAATRPPVDLFSGPAVDAVEFLAPLAVDVASGFYDEGRFVPYEEAPSRHVYGTGGIKDNLGKAPIDLLPSRPLVAIARILAFGARKYRPHNWRRGLPWSDTYASLQRHLLAWNDGEDLDQETGESHLAHAGCQLLFLLDYVITGVGEDTDNRFIPCAVEGCALEGLHPTTDHAELEEAS